MVRDSWRGQQPAPERRPGRWYPRGGRFPGRAARSCGTTTPSLRRSRRGVRGAPQGFSRTAPLGASPSSVHMVSPAATPRIRLHSWSGHSGVRRPDSVSARVSLIASLLKSGRPISAAKARASVVFPAPGSPLTSTVTIRRPYRRRPCRRRPGRGPAIRRLRRSLGRFLRGEGVRTGVLRGGRGGAARS